MIRFQKCFRKAVHPGFSSLPIFLLCHEGFQNRRQGPSPAIVTIGGQLAGLDAFWSPPGGFLAALTSVGRTPRAGGGYPFPGMLMASNDQPDDQGAATCFGDRQNRVRPATLPRRRQVRPVRW